MSEEHADTAHPKADQDVTPSTVAKLLLFLVWWFSGIGVGTGFLSPGVIGDGIPSELFMAILLSHFCSFLLIIVLLPGPDDDELEQGADGL